MLKISFSKSMLVKARVKERGRMNSATPFVKKDPTGMGVWSQR
jgi:hypothetical protein